MANRVKAIFDRRRQKWTLRWKEPDTNVWRQRIVEAANKNQAKKVAAQLEADLDQGRYLLPGKVTWDEFRRRYEAEKLASLAKGTWGSAESALNHAENLLKPDRLADVTSSALSVLQAKLRKTGIAEASIACHLRHLRAALNWAHSVGMLPTVPAVNMPKRAKGGKLMKGRPITGEEFERMLAAVPKVRPTDALQWDRLLQGLWLSGLRLGEALNLSWNLEAAFSIDLSGKHPRFRILAEAQKSHADQLLPMTPDFAEFVLATPETDRVGPVFTITSRRSGATPLLYWVSATITKIGQAAGVKVNAATKSRRDNDGKLATRSVVKYASAHDLRRAFGTRWAARVNTATLKLLMRHSDVATTERYYVSLDADEVSASLWGQHQAIGMQLAASRSSVAEMGGALGGAPRE